jgi:tetratricopeptide (TPR) repeat protein
MDEGLSRVKALAKECNEHLQNVRFDKAVECAEAAVRLNEELLFDDTVQMLDIYGLAGVAYSLNAFHLTGKTELGEQRYITSDNHFALSLYYYSLALDIAKDTYGENSPQVARIYSNMGSVYRLMDDDWQEEEYYMQAIGIYLELADEFKEKYGEHSKQLADIYENLSMLYKNLDCTKEMLLYIEKAEHIYDELGEHDCSCDHHHGHGQGHNHDHE